MYKNKTFLAIIPARGGSKRLPNKNILNLAGKPLIVWSIEAAKKSKYIDTTVVSSDSNKILEIARNYDVVTIKRPDYLASDTAKSIDVIKHAIENVNEKYDYLVLLQPTSPLRNEKHIDEAIELLEQKKADAIISVCEAEHSPLWSNTLPDDLSMNNFLKDEIKNKRSQDLPKFYKINGAIYIYKVERLLKENSFFIKNNIYAYIMDRKNSVDIDDEVDFKLAEVILKDKNEV
ncbi:acylneuraminate cytidylyltransferase family protein [Nitrosophilus labii]|uniref:acylneuraminate cytidylyltransferase family protein n=1 Tax=Nitrosophilus labii TaxID=2706014 RepID=UPI00165707C3|nr:acylneuraminate cytidylyltransferase family protein [Nitrosophilus labii]